MTSISKNVYTDILHELVNKYKNTYYNTIKINTNYLHIGVKSNTHVDFGLDANEKDTEFKFGDLAIISKYKNIFAKGYTPIWSEEAFLVKNIPWAYVVSDVNCEEVIETIYQKGKSNLMWGRKSNQEKWCETTCQMERLW